MSLEATKTALPKAETDEFAGAQSPHVQFLTPVSDADDEYCVMRGTLPPGAIVPIHSHAERETFYVLEGEVQGLRDDRWITLRRNDIFDVPGGLKHAWRNISDSPATMIVVASMRLARFLRDAPRLPAGEAGAPAPEEVQRFLDFAQAYGYWMGSPEDNAAVGLSFG